MKLHHLNCGSFVHEFLRLSLATPTWFAIAKKSLIENFRYHSIQWSHGPKWIRHAIEGESWFGFRAVRALDARMPEILLIPLFGHTRGHCGVAVHTEDGWILHAGDAYFHHQEMSATQTQCPMGLSIFQKFIQIDGKTRIENQDKLRQLKMAHDPTVRIFCSHDLTELERCQQTPKA